MKANELMIGDWVMFNPNVFNDEHEPYREPHPYQIKTGECIDDAVNGCYEPIPLTAEILEKNGFSKSRLMGEQRHFTYYLAPSVSLLAIYDVDFSLKIGDCARYIKYVHELQHALRLCGIEKEIEL